MPKKILVQVSKVNKDIKNIKPKKQGQVDSASSSKSKKLNVGTNKFSGFRLSNLVKGGLTVLLSFLTIFGIAQAIPPTFPYSPGATLDPSCMPGDTNCTVIAPAISGANTNITSLLGLTTPLGINQGGTGSNSGSIVGTDALTFSAGGTNQNITLTPSGSGFTILNGNIGIGTTAPTRRLAIVDPGVGFDRPALDTLAMFTADTERMRIDSAGNIGIGATAPRERLEVAGNIMATGNIFPAGTIWVMRNSEVTNDWGSVTYGNGLFVAVSWSTTGNRVMTSPDGINWATRTSAADNYWNSVTFGNGLFVAVAGSGTGNRVMTSPDGINWTARTSPLNDWRSVTFGNGLFVAVATFGTGNRVMTSPDGINWTTRSAPHDLWFSVTYGNGFVCCCFLERRA